MHAEPERADAPDASGESPDADDEALLALARAARANAYAPYSGFAVGAAVATERGIFCGVNVENAAYPLGVCAERNAIAAAAAAGAREVRAVAVIADTERPVAPCGGCRQVIHEFGPRARVILGSTRGAVSITSADALLPGAFGPADLAREGPRAAAPAAAEPPRGPLAGLCVLDLTRILAGPYCTMRLADLGATVWKVENPDGGDDTRTWGPPFQNGVSTYFLAVNRNKRSVAIDLKSEAGKRVLWRLVEAADVVVENFRPGTLERLGFGWEALQRRNPRVIYCSVSGYGHRSRYAARPSYDVVIQGEAGVMDLTGLSDGPPLKCGLSIADLVAGMNAAEGILAALRARERTGRGSRVDVALFDGILSLLTYQGQMQLSCGVAPRRLGNAHPSIVPYETLRTGDGHLNVGVGNEALWRRFCQALEQPGWQEDVRFATNTDRVAHRAELKALIEARLAEGSTAHWEERLDAAGVPCGRVRTVAEALQMARDDERGLLVEAAHAVAGVVPMVGSPVRVEGPAGSEGDGAAGACVAPPLLGEHTDLVLAEVGFEAHEIAALRAEGAVA